MWTSKTSQFPQGEISQLETMSVGDLTAALLGSDSVVALRGMAEVKLNGNTTKLNALLRNQALTAHWRGYTSDNQVNSRDRGYARDLEAALAAL
jgi:hypothetical protein